MQKIVLTEEDLKKEKIFKETRWNGYTLYFFKQDYILKQNENLNDNDLKTLEYLDEERANLNLIEELLIPEALAVYKGKEVGSITKKGYLETLHDLVKEKASWDLKITLLKNLGLVLQKLETLRKEENRLTDFFLGDLHSENILIKKDTQKIQICDLDSAKIKTNEPPLTKYFAYLYKDLIAFPKYTYQKPYQIIPNEESDLFAYIIIIMEVLFEKNIFELSPNQYFPFLSKLHSLGLPKPLVTIFKNIYSNNPNQNPFPYLEDIPKKLERSMIK